MPFETSVAKKAFDDRTQGGFQSGLLKMGVEGGVEGGVL